VGDFYRGHEAGVRNSKSKLKTFQLKVSEVKDEKKKTIKQHRKIKYESDNKKVAKVDKKGKITAKGKGKTTIPSFVQVFMHLAIIRGS
jgi:hypothetical protein